ncbi:MAG: dihydroorotase [Bacteroidia bacterium]
MPFLIKNAIIIQEGHPRHLKKSDILLSGGKIQKVAAKIESDATVISGKNLHVSFGWHDMRSHLADPGLEYKENIHQLAAAAARGGFTSFSTLPNTDPVMDSKSGIQYAIKANQSDLSELLPFGSLSEKNLGKDLAEMYDMHQHGAVAFTDGNNAVKSGLLKKALQYVQSFNGLIVTLPLDASLHHDGQINESESTVVTGLKSSPALAEYSCVKQQLDVLEYTGGRLHFSCISTKESVNLIKEAKKKGLNVSCDVSIYNLCFTDEKVVNFDANFKLMPMLRTKEDRKALIKGVNDGTIDAIVSNHQAQNVELKKVEFDYADYGAISLQTFYSLYNEHLQNEIDNSTFVNAVSSNPRRILGLEQTEIKEGEAANLCVFDSKEQWMLNKDTNESQAVNTHLWNSQLDGKIVASIRGSKVKLY